MTQKYYHARLMPAQATQAVFDGLELARTGQRLNGNIPVPTLVRLQDSLFDQAGEIRYEVKGGHDARRRPVLMLEVTGVLHLQCQRCLGPVDFPLRLSSTLLLVSGAVAGGDPDDGDLEWIEAGPGQDVASLVEDEILLGLPYAPMHEPGQCARDGKTGPGGERNAAFAKLAALKRDDN
jgi:uncharacterized protein